MGAGQGDIFSPLGIFQLLANLIGSKQHQDAFNEAKDANTSRYEDILNALGGLKARTDVNLAGGQRREGDYRGGLYDSVVGGSQALGNQLSGSYANRAGNLMDMFRSGASGLQDQFGGLSNQVGGLYDQRTVDTMGRLGDVSADVRSQLQDRMKRNLDYLEGAGQQERADINRQFDAATGRQQADLAARGMTGAGAIQSLRSGLDRQRSDALGALDERLRAQRIAADSALSGDVASASERLGTLGAGMYGDLTGQGIASRERLGTLGAGLGERLLGAQTGLYGGATGDTLGAMERTGNASLGLQAGLGADFANMLARQTSQRIGTDMDITGMRTGVMERRSDPYPQGNFWTNQAGLYGQMLGNKAMAGATPQPDFWQSMMGGLAPGLGQAGLYAGLGGLGALAGGGGASLASFFPFLAGLCWVADAIYGEGSDRAAKARRYATTHDTPFLRRYAVHGRQWAKKAATDAAFRNAIRPIWDAMLEAA